MTIILVAAVYTLGLALMARGLQSVPRGYEDDCGFHEVYVQRNEWAEVAPKTRGW